MAEYFDYEADFGGGAALDLPRYYTMCNDLLRELENYPELIALHKAYAAQELGGIEDSSICWSMTYCTQPTPSSFTPRATPAAPPPRNAPRLSRRKIPAPSCVSASASASRPCRSCWPALPSCPT